MVLITRRWHLGEERGGQLQLQALLLAQVTLQVLAHCQRPAFHADEKARQFGSAADTGRLGIWQRKRSQTVTTDVSRQAVAMLMSKGLQVCMRNDIAEKLSKLTGAPDVLADGLQLELVGGQSGLHHGVDAEAVLHDIPHLLHVRIAQP